MRKVLLARSPGKRYAPTTTYDVLTTTAGETITMTGGDPISVMTSEKDGGRAWIIEAKKIPSVLHAKQIRSKLVVDEWQQ